MPTTAATSRECARASANCDLLTGLDSLHAARCAEAGLTDEQAVVSAAAVGLVIEVWRNGPVEDMHARRRGPGDAAMFAQSTALHSEALQALTADDQGFGLLDFEEVLLDRNRPWAGTDGETLKTLGYGFLGTTTAMSRIGLPCFLAFVVTRASANHFRSTSSTRL